MDLLYMLVIPAVAAALSLIPCRRSGFPAVVTILGGVAMLYCALQVAAASAAGARVVAVPNWLGCDSFGALVLLLVAYVGLATSIFSWGCLGRRAASGDPARLRRYYALYNIFLLSILAVPMLVQVPLVWIALELTTLSSVFLVGFDRTREALEAAWKYAILTTMGAIVALFGILLYYWGMRVNGVELYTWAGLAAAMPKMSPILLESAFILVLIGFGSKAGMAPLHTWLPDAYSQAPVPICVLLSVVETATIPYVIFRLWPGSMGLTNGTTGAWLMVFGLISVAVAALLLLQVKDYKRLFAFSTIEQLGIILVAAGLGGTAGGYGATYQIMTHIITKSFCFFAVGAALLVVGSREIASVRGLIRTSPVAGVSLLLGALAISGAPPFAVFLSEFSVFRAGLSNGQYAVIGLLALFVGIAFIGIMLHSSRMVFGRPATATAPVRTTLPVSYAASLCLTAIPIVLLWIYMPGTVANLLRLAGASIGR